MYHDEKGGGQGQSMNRNLVLVLHDGECIGSWHDLTVFRLFY